MMEPEKRNEMREYAWKYFSLHADQRLKTFNFYLLLVTVVVGGLLAFLRDAKLPILALPAGPLLIYLSFVFDKLDRRNRELITHAESMLMHIEAETPELEAPLACRLFTNEDQKTEEIRRDRRVGWHPATWLRGHYSYSDCFRAMFWAVGLLGMVVTAAVFFLPARVPTTVPTPVPQQNFFIGSQSATAPAATP